MSTITLTRQRFAAIHELIVSKCYPDASVRERMEKKSEAEFYGFEPRITDHGISSIMGKQLGQAINGRALYNLKLQYNKQSSTIEISASLLEDCLEFIGCSSLKDVDEIAENLCKNRVNFPPLTIRKSKFPTGIPQVTVKFSNESKHNIDELSKTRWGFYCYDYQSASTKEIRIKRLILSFKKEQEDLYSVLLNETGPPHPDFFGKVTKVDPELLVAELQANGELMYLMLSVEGKGNQDLYIGMYFKHDGIKKLFSGPVIIQKLKEEGNLITPMIIDLDSGEGLGLPDGIRAFFADKRYNYLKTPKKFSDREIINWIGAKRTGRSENKDYDLFVSATIISSKEKKERYIKASQKIEESIVAFLSEHFTDKPDDSSLRKLFDDIHSIRTTSDDLQVPDSGPLSDPYLLNDEVLSIIENLGNEIEELEKEKIYYSYRERPINQYHNQDSKVALERDLKRLKHSKAYLLFCPYNYTFSSCWVILGWAIMLGMPIFIVYRNEKNLPFLLWEASSLPQVHMIKIRNNNLASVIDYFKNNDYGKRYFS